MTSYGGELYPSYSAVQARREWEIELIKEKLGNNEPVDINVCRVERVSADSAIVRLGLKRGKLLYVFKYPTHNVERDKHRNVITRARFIKQALESAGYTPIPWDFKKAKPPKFWEDGAMEEEDDDLYGPSETTAAPPEPKTEDVKAEGGDDSGDEPMDEGLESGEEEDEDDSDSDLEIIIDKPAAPKPTVQSQPQESKAIKIEAPPQTSSATPAQAAKPAVPQLPQQPGTAYPAVRTSTIDVNADPTYPALDKPITQVDIDADLAEASKPWRLPGADQSDYFNYGFDEFTWEMYRQRQQNMANTLAAQKAETAQLQQFFNNPMGGPAMPGANPSTSGSAANTAGVPGAPTGPSGGGGGAGMSNMAAMPPGAMNEEQMQMMFQQMAQSGMDPSQMDFGTFMQMAGGFGAPAGQQSGGFGGGPQQGNQPAGGGGQRGGRRGGRGGW